LKIALSQYAMVESIAQNLAKVAEHAASARRCGAELVIFPELCVSPFFPQYRNVNASRYAMSVESECVREFRNISSSLQLTMAPNVYLEEARNRFDASICINQLGEILGISKMVHIGQLRCFYEQDYYTPSDTGFRVYDVNGLKVGFVICFDRHFPESIRTCVLLGADLIVIPTANITGDPRELYEWEIRVAAMQNGVYIAMCNRVGVEGDVRFYGESILVDPFGEVIAKADEDEALLVGTVEARYTSAARSLRPYLSLRSPQFYK
jgi:predicted amidohydrolase